MMQNRQITIEDKFGNVLGQVKLRADDPVKASQRIQQMTDKAMQDFDQRCIGIIQKGFSASDISFLFDRHGPRDMVGDMAYCGVVVNALMAGLKAAIENNRSVTVRIDT